MSRQTSFLHQRQVLKQFSNFLSEVGGELNGLSQKYEHGIRSLYEEQGLMEEIYKDYEAEYLVSMKEALSSLSNRLSEDIAFVEKEIDFISSR